MREKKSVYIFRLIWIFILFSGNTWATYSSTSTDQKYTSLGVYQENQQFHNMKTTQFDSVVVSLENVP